MTAIYLIKRTNQTDWPFDQNHGHVVAADDELQARVLCADAKMDEGRDIWLDPTRSSCEQLGADQKPGIILTDFCGA